VGQHIFLCDVGNDDMRQKMFTFSKETNTSFVKLNVARENMTSATICLRIFSDLTRAYSLFSLTTPSSVNEMLIYKKPQSKSMFLVKVGEGVAVFRGQNFQLNKWQSICATWNADSGLVQLWIDEKASSRKFTTSSNLEGNFTVVLGQDQNPADGRPHRSRSFVGMMRDVHMWDYVLSDDNMRSYSQPYTAFPGGNVFTWTSLDFDIIGNKNKGSCFFL
uniref:Pentraxin family member n=1 Tax=Neogobius melanostomus TaxID=47308 RepID=A0A8C6SGP2_9GOBI